MFFFQNSTLSFDIEEEDDPDDESSDEELLEVQQKRKRFGNKGFLVHRLTKL